MATIAEVRESFETAFAAIAVLDQTLAAESKMIKRRAFKEGRPLEDVEIARRKAIAATRMELGDALQDLGLSAIDALENSDDIDLLIGEINAVNQQLKDDLDHLKTMAAHAEKAAKVAEALATAAGKITELVL